MSCVYRTHVRLTDDYSDGSRIFPHAPVIHRWSKFFSYMDAFWFYHFYKASPKDHPALKALKATLSKIRHYRCMERWNGEASAEALLEKFTRQMPAAIAVQGYGPLPIQLKDFERTAPRLLASYLKEFSKLNKIKLLADDYFFHAVAEPLEGHLFLLEEKGESTQEERLAAIPESFLVAAFRRDEIFEEGNRDSFERFFEAVDCVLNESEWERWYSVNNPRRFMERESLAAIQARRDELEIQLLWRDVTE